MAWQDIANKYLGAEAPGVISTLSGINPNFDWSQALLWNLPSGAQAAVDAGTFDPGNYDGWFDPSRDAPASVAWGAVKNLQSQYPDQPWLQQAVSTADQQRQQQVAQIQQQQASQGGGGLFGGGLGSLLGIGGLALGGLGLAGVGPLAGMLGGAADAGLAAGVSGDAASTLGAAGDFSSIFGSSVIPGSGVGLGAATAPATGAAAMSGTSLDALFGPLPGAGTMDLTNFFGPSVIPSTVGGTAGGDLTSFFGPSVGQDFSAFDPASAAAGLSGGGGFDMSSLLKSLIPGGGTGTGLDLSKLLFGSGGASSLFGNRGLVGTAAAEVPGTLALDYAKQQPGIDTSALSSVIGKLGGNTNAIVKAATDPVNENIAAGYGDLVQRLGNRGVLGSSFGNTDIGNYLATTGTTLGNVGAQAAQGALGLQGNLAAQLAQLTGQNQQIKNSLYGRAFDILGRGLNPGAYSGFGALGTQA